MPVGRLSLCLAVLLLLRRETFEQVDGSSVAFPKFGWQRCRFGSASLLTEVKLPEPAQEAHPLLGPFLNICVDAGGKVDVTAPTCRLHTDSSPSWLAGGAGCVTSEWVRGVNVDWNPPWGHQMDQQVPNLPHHTGSFRFAPCSQNTLTITHSMCVGFAQIIISDTAYCYCTCVFFWFFIIYCIFHVILCRLCFSSPLQRFAPGALCLNQKLNNKLFVFMAE